MSVTVPRLRRRIDRPWCRRPLPSTRLAWWARRRP